MLEVAIGMLTERRFPISSLFVIKPSLLKKIFEVRKIERIFGFSDNFDYYINDIKYTTPSTHLWIAFKTSDGNIYEGNFVQDTFEGVGSYLWKETGVYWHGSFANDKLNGVGIFILPDGNSHIREFNTI
jgi:hypothetical protein